MHVISRKKLREFWAQHPDAEGPLSEWFKIARKATWEKFADVRAIYGNADKVGKYIVINIGGNKYRLVVEIDYDHKRLLIRYVLTHKEYDRGAWKSR